MNLCNYLIVYLRVTHSWNIEFLLFIYESLHLCVVSLQLKNLVRFDIYSYLWMINLCSSMVVICIHLYSSMNNYDQLRVWNMRIYIHPCINLCLHTFITIHLHSSILSILFVLHLSIFISINSYSSLSFAFHPYRSEFITTYLCSSIFMSIHLFSFPWIKGEVGQAKLCCRRRRREPQRQRWAGGRC